MREGGREREREGGRKSTHLHYFSLCCPCEKIARDSEAEEMVLRRKRIIYLLKYSPFTHPSFQLWSDADKIWLQYEGESEAGSSQDGKFGS